MIVQCALLKCYTILQHRDSSVNIPLPPDQHRCSDEAKWRLGGQIPQIRIFTLPPADTSSAVAVAGSLTVISLATRPCTALRSKPRSGSLNWNCSCGNLLTESHSSSVKTNFLSNSFISETIRWNYHRVLLAASTFDAQMRFHACERCIFYYYYYF